jgi:hypothetical protein
MGFLLPPSPPPPSKSSLKLVCNVNIVFGNLKNKSENSQDYAQKLQTKLYVPEFGFWIKKTSTSCAVKAVQFIRTLGGAKSRDRKKCWHFSSSTSLTPRRGTNHSMLLGFSHRLISDKSTPSRLELKIVNALMENIYFLFSEENIHHCYEHRFKKIVGQIISE